MPNTLRTVLVVGGRDDFPVSRDVAAHLQGPRSVAVAVDACETAIEMMEVVDFAAIVVIVAGPFDWVPCSRILAHAPCPVAVVTRLLARDRRYRDRAFEMGIAAYVRCPYARSRLNDVLQRMIAGERAVELVGSAAHRVS